ncbi:hypothetical protein WJX72_003669 [[Myrmecia] bisecta]|uniref:Tail-anchored protein insertion receptor WRB n=1 Tax=[Myrmecia] bisecta TaxID=41462 RepID=A0AAW1PSI3_9CHLO
MVLLAFVALFLYLVIDVLQALYGQKQVKRILLQRGKLQSEVAELQRQAARLSSPATFAQSAKLQRRAIAKEKEGELLQQWQERCERGWSSRLATLVKLALTVALAASCWGQPAAFINPEVMWPLGRWLAAPHAAKLVGTGAVTVLPWLGLCKRASSAIASALVGV